MFLKASNDIYRIHNANSVHVSTASGDGAACVAGAAVSCRVDQSLTGVDRGEFAAWSVNVCWVASQI